MQNWCLVTFASNFNLLHNSGYDAEVSTQISQDNLLYKSNFMEIEQNRIENNSFTNLFKSFFANQIN